MAEHEASPSSGKVKHQSFCSAQNHQILVAAFVRTRRSKKGICDVPRTHHGKGRAGFRTNLKNLDRFSEPASQFVSRIAEPNRCQSIRKRRERSGWLSGLAVPNV